MTNRSFLTWALVILVAGLTLRTLWLRADPPTTSVGIVWHDEGAWTHNARNKALWGQWVTDKWNPVYVAPVFIALEYAAFRELGVGLRQARTVSVIAGLVAIAFLMAGLAAAANRRAALIGGVLLATNYVFISWNRAALMDSTVTAFVVIAWAGYAMAERRPLWGLVAGAAAILAYFTKASAAFFVVAIALDAMASIAIARLPHLRQRLGVSAPDPAVARAAMLTLAGAVAAGLPILVSFVLPHWSDYFAYNVVMSIERKPSYGLRALADRTSLLPLAQDFYTQIWLVVVAAMAGALTILARWRTARASHRLLVLWLLLGFAELMAHDSTNSRYHVVLIPAFVGLASLLMAAREPLLSAGPVNRVFVVPALLYLGYVVFASFLRLPFTAEVEVGHYSLVVWLSAGLSVALTALTLLRWDRVTEWLSRRHVPETVATIVVAVTVCWNLFEYGAWAAQRTDRNYRASVTLGGLLPQGTLVQGILANGLSLENRIRPLFIGNHFGNYDDRFQRDDVRYILTDVLPSEGYESQQGSGLISEILDRYPAVGRSPNRRAVATFELTWMTHPIRAALFDKFPDRR